MRKVIVDGDWGGDEMQLAAVLLAHPRQAQVIGATCVFGNTSLDQVVRNASDLLKFAGAPRIGVYAGCAGPNGEPLREGDNAHSSDGIGGVVLPRSSVKPRAMHAVDFILDTLRRKPAGTVTITATGPLSNIAAAFTREPDTMRRMAELVIMGGCTADMPARDRPMRRGNITPEAEFNFYMAPRDAAVVMQSGLPITLMPMNCTHQMTLTPERERLLRETFPDRTIAEAVLGMMKAPEEIDSRKFGIGPVMHDVHTALHLVDPDAYEGRRGFVTVLQDGPSTGGTVFTPDDKGPVMVMERPKHPDRLFRIVAQSLQIRVGREELKQKAGRAPRPVVKPV